MKRFISVFLSILILIQCMLVATPVSADSAAVQARIDALPDASTLTKGQEPYATEILSLWDEVYTLSSTTEPAPDMTKLYAATHAVLTVSQQCWVITPRDGYQYAGSSAIRTYMVKYAGDGGAAFKEYLKDIFREINSTPQSSRPSGNDYNKLRNQVDGFFTPQDRIDSIIPTVDQINNMTDADLAWYTNHSGWGNEVQKTWSRVQELSNDTSLLTLDLTALKVITERTFNLQQRVNILPTDTNWWVLETSPEKIAEIRQEVIYLYDHIFALDTTEDIPSNISALVRAAKYTLTPVERAAYIPTLEQYYNNMNDNQRTDIHTELVALYEEINKLSVSEPHPDMEELYEYCTEILTWQERINALPKKDKAKQITGDDKDLLADEIRAIYDYVESIGEGTYPNLTRLRETAPAILTLEELIARLPDTDTLDAAGEKYRKFVSEEVIHLRNLIDDEENEENPSNIAKLLAIEEYFFGEVETIEVETYDELKAVFDLMNTGDPKKKIVKLMADIENSSGALSLNQGTLTILGQGHTLSVNSISSTNANLNLGSSNVEDTLVVSRPFTSSNNFILVNGSTAKLNIYSGTTIGPFVGYGPTIDMMGNSVLNLYGGTITDCTNGYCPVRLAGSAVFNMYDGLISDCTGSSGGVVGCTSSAAPLDASQISDVAFNMYGGEIRNCISTGGYGGGVVYFFTANGATFNMHGGTISGCEYQGTSSLGGSVAFIYKGVMNMTGGTIKDCFCNYSGSNGGAVFLYSGCSFNMSGGKFQNCGSKASKKYSGIALLNSNSTFTMTGGEISGCRTGIVYGAAAMLLGPTDTVNLVAGTIKDNVANYGGAVCNNGGVVNISSDVVITDNITARGGAVANLGGTVTIAPDAQIYNNSAQDSGADIYSQSGATLTIGNVVDGVMLDDGHPITDWYSDTSSDRWSCYIAADDDHNPTIAPGTYTTLVCAKAAHESHQVQLYDAPGRALNQLTDSVAGYEVAADGAFTGYWEIESDAADWKLSASDKLPKGTKMTLIYYPDGTEASGAEYYYHELEADAYGLLLSSFVRMGTGEPFERTDTNNWFSCQISFVLPDGNTLDSLQLALMDTDVLSYSSLSPMVSVAFDADSSVTPSGKLEISDIDNGTNSISAKLTVSDLKDITRSQSDPQHNVVADIDDYTILLVLELVNQAGDHEKIPQGSVVTIGGTNATIKNGLAYVPVTADGDYDVSIDSLPDSKLMLKASLCAVGDTVFERPMALKLGAVSTPVINLVKAMPEAIEATLKSGDANRAVDVSTLATSKTLEFALKYIPVASTEAIDITVYSKKSDGTYEEVSPAWTTATSNIADGTADAAVTVPQDTPAGTYRIKFTMGSAVYNYNIIVYDR